MTARSFIESSLARELLRCATGAYGALLLVTALALLLTGDDGRVATILAALLVPVTVGLASAAVRAGAAAARLVRSRRVGANVGRELAVLAPDYRVLRIALSPGHERHVAIGPNGIFVINARADGGRVTASSHRLFVNARPPWRDLVDDCRVDTLRVRDRIRRTLGRQVPVHAVLCFARALVAVGQEIRGVKVVHAARLARLIASVATAVPLTTEDVQDVAAALERRWEAPAPVPSRRLAALRKVSVPVPHLALVSRASVRSREPS